jgi:hypothetical protein
VAYFEVEKSWKVPYDVKMFTDLLFRFSNIRCSKKGNMFLNKYFSIVS